MLKFLFGRYSRFVRFLELTAVLFSGIIVSRWAERGFGIVPDYLFALLLLHYLFIRFCYLYRWYPGIASRDPSETELGIEIHFLKALVPTSYILSLTALLFLIGLAWPATILSNLMMIVVSGVNVILIGFHFRDNDILPVNYFTRELILSDAAAMTQKGGHKEHLVQLKRTEKRERPAA